VVGAQRRLGILLEWEYAKFIRRGWDAFAAHVRYEVGDGSRILFWHDVW